MSKRKRLTILDSMIPHIVDTYTEYYNGNPKDKTTKTIGEELNEYFSEIYNEDYKFDESAYRKVFNNYKNGYDSGMHGNANEDELTRLAKARSKINVERKVLQAEKIELNKIARETAREQVIMDRLAEEIRKLDPLVVPEIIKLKENKKAGILCFGDEHYGVEFEIKGIFGETINKYNSEIFEKRMNELLTKTIEIVQREGLQKISVYSMGDYCDGILRTSQLRKLQYGVVDSTIMYTEYISKWLNKLSEYVQVDFHMTDGNHSELRMLGEPKGTFSDDNMGKIVAYNIKTRLENNKNFKIIENPTGMIYENIFNYNILGIHGEVKDMEKAIKDLSHIYDIKTDILISGHKHHSNATNVGLYKDVITVPSIVGADSYAISINKISNPGATFLVIDENEGINCQYNIRLGNYN